jgi:hypothetical protein
MAATIRATVFGAFVSLLAASVPAPAADIPVVTVTAPRPPTARELAGLSVPNFVRNHSTPSRVIGQLTRWEKPVCPRTLGLDDAMDSFVTARVLAVAAAVGAPHAESPNCKPNVFILFALEPQRVVQTMLKSDSKLLGFHYPTETTRFTVFNHPIQGWYVTATGDSMGAELIDDPDAFDNEVDFGGGSTGSRLQTHISALIGFATIIVDFHKVKGMTIGPISDYLAVLTLTQAHLSDGCSQLPSIMDLMAAGCQGNAKPDQVTAGDLAYLRALYSLDLQRPLALERSNLATAMFRQFRQGR